MDSRWCWGLLIAGFALVGTYTVAAEPLHRDLIWHVVSFGALLAMLLGTRANRPPYRPWRLGTAGVAVIAVGRLLHASWWPADAAEVVSQAAIACYALGALLIAGAILDLARTKAETSSWEALLDSTIVTVALATILWEVTFEHTLVDGATLVDQLPVFLAQLAPVWVFATALRLIFTGGSRLASGWFLLASVTSGVLGSALWSWQQAVNGSVWSGPVALLWLSALVLAAAAAVHPSSRQLGTSHDLEEVRGLVSRIALLALALLAPPVALVLHSSHDQPGSVLSAPVVASALLSVLVCWRFARLLIDREQARSALERQAERHQQLARLGARALAGMAPDDLFQAAERVVRTYLPARSCRAMPADQLIRQTAGAVLVPIGDSDSPFGTLVAFPSQPIGHDGTAFLHAVANVLAGAIQRTKAEEDVRWRSLHDGLTGLPNRVLLIDRMKQALNRLERGTGTVAVLFADLDGFKEINDTLGHAAGDRLLREMAHRLQAVVRSQDTLGRFAGDEFVVIVEDSEEATVLAVAERVLSALRQPLSLLGDQVLSGSMGIAFAQGGDVSPDILLRQADAAMYLAKAAGRNRYAIFDDSLRVQVERKHRIERDLRDVTARNEMHMVYQPFIALGAGGSGAPVDVMVAVEALARWTHPALGPVSPGEFIPIAETTGSIVGLGAWILRQACEDLVMWRSQLPETSPFTVFVNLSPVQLSEPRLLNFLDKCLEETGADPQYIGFEITESAVLEDDRHINRVLAGLKARGCRIALDDFGTGYSSLAHLRRVPLDLLKVDASFVDRIGERGHDRAIVSAVVGLARELGFVVLAEGVETTQQLESVRDVGCDLAQGYLFGRPAESTAILQLLAPPESAEAPTAALAGEG